MIVRDSRGKPIRLRPQEQRVADWCQRRINATPGGYLINITTLTQIVAKVQEQKFFTIPFANYIPVRSGEGAFSYELLTWQSFATGGDFETGIIDTGADNSRLASVDAGVQPVRVPVRSWAKQITWSLMELNYATRYGNWNQIEAKERARKKNWDLGLQRLAFLGLKTGGVPGLMTLPTTGANAVQYDNTTLTTRLGAMDPATFSSFLGALLQEYQAGNAYVQMPNRFLIPQSDYNLLASPTSPTYPLISKLDLMRNTFRTLTGRQDFEILPNAYGMVSNSGGALALDRYVLYNYDEETIRMDLPVDYTPTLQQSVNGFHFQNVAYGQFTGVGLYRPNEVLYIDYEGA